MIGPLFAPLLTLLWPLGCASERAIAPALPAATTDSGDVDTAADTAADTAPPGTAPCDAAILSLTPAEGAQIHPASPIELALSAPLPPDQLTLAIDGVPGRIEELGGARYRLIPDPLAWDTAYTLRAAACGQEIARTLQTASGPVAADLAGRAFTLDLRSPDLRWEEPAEVGALFLSFAETDLLRIEVLAQDPGGTLDMAIAPDTSDPEDEARVQHTRFAQVDFSLDPLFSASAPGLDLPADDNTLSLQALTLSARFAPDGSALRDLRLSAALDTRSLQRYGLDICDAMDCVQCPESRTQTCLPLVVSAAQADLTR